jgi:hypothetical protein
MATKSNSSLDDLACFPLLDSLSLHFLIFLIVISFQKTLLPLSQAGLHQQQKITKNMQKESTNLFKCDHNLFKIDFTMNLKVTTKIYQTDHIILRLSVPLGPLSVKQPLIEFEFEFQLADVGVIGLQVKPGSLPLYREDSEDSWGLS